MEYPTVGIVYPTFSPPLLRRQVVCGTSKEGVGTWLGSVLTCLRCVCENFRQYCRARMTITFISLTLLLLIAALSHFY